MMMNEGEVLMAIFNCVTLGQLSNRQVTILTSSSPISLYLVDDDLTLLDERSLSIDEAEDGADLLTNEADVSKDTGVLDEEAC